jgi:hypothetical protein
LEARYSSTEIPFKNTAEIIATLSAVYHDHNQGSKARKKLRKLKYDNADKDMDIHQFIGKVNSLADKAGIAEAERKIVLYEHCRYTFLVRTRSMRKLVNIFPHPELDSLLKRTTDNYQGKNTVTTTQEV